MLFRLLWWTRCAVIEALRRWFAPRFREIAEPALSPEEVYIAERAKRLVASFEKKDCQFKMNANMTSEFYRRDGFKYCLPHRPNDGKVAKLKISDSPFEVDSSPSSGSVHSAWTIEKMWIARVLVENTPRGNVYMHYNIYKGAFAYYCDTSLPYALANAAAARYVLTFACRDLYLDESVLGAERRSPLIALAASAEAAARGASRAALLLPDRKSGATSAAPLPFAKLKKYGAHGVTSASPRYTSTHAPSPNTAARSARMASRRVGRGAGVTSSPASSGRSALPSRGVRGPSCGGWIAASRCR